MSVSQNYPSIKPSLSLDFANVKALDPRVTFARASTGAYYGTETAKAEENLLLQSQFASGWAIFGSAVLTPNNTVAPDGTTTAALLSSPATSDYVYQIPPTIIGQTYVFSVFVKNSTATISSLYVRSSSTGAFILLNWSGATLASVTESTGTATFSSVGNDWYRIAVTYTAVESAARHRIYGGDNSSATGDIFIWGAQLEQRSAPTAYTPTTTQPITNYIPVLETASANVARFDHNPVTGESLGLLVEEQRTNLLTYSEQFDNAAWTASSVTVVTDQTISPDGNLTGDKLFTNNGSGVGLASNVNVQNVTAAAGNYTLSVYAKDGEFNQIGLRVRDVSSSTNNVSVAFNLTDGTIATAAANSGTFTGATASSVAVGNGWYRFVLTGTTTGASALRLQIAPLDSSITTGDGYSGIYIWGAQLEAGAFPTSYIPTVASQVTRSADSASMTGTNFSDWYRQDEGTLYGEWNSVGSLSDNRMAYAFSDGTFNNTNYLAAAVSGASNQSLNTIRSSNGLQASLGISGAYTNYAYRKTAAAYKINDFALSGDGFVATVDTFGVLPSGVDRLYIGANWAGTGNFISGTIRKLSYYPKRLEDTQLQALTS